MGLLSVVDSFRLRAAVREAVLSPSACVPPAVVLLTMAGGNQAQQLRPLQFRFVVSESCLLRRVVTYAFANHTDPFGMIVPSSRGSLPTYSQFNWIKWHLMASALKEARACFFFDCDVLLLRNPFAAHAVVWDFASAAASCATHLLFQYEGPGSNPLNGGQLLACSRPAVQHVLAAQPAEDDERFEKELDQEIAYQALEQAKGALSLSLISRLPDPYAGNCWFGPPEAPPWCDLITFHAHCTGSLQAKLDRLHLVLAEVSRCPRLAARRNALVANRSFAANRRLLVS